jgi:hypothetical protein
MAKTSAGMEDPEIVAMATVRSALEPLSDDVRARVLSWARSRYAANPVSPAAVPGRSEATMAVARDLNSFKTLGELMVACSVKGDDDRALVASGFVSRDSEDGTFTAAQVSGALKYLGFRVDNITRLFDVLAARRPAPIVQLRKSGTTRQARKLFKFTDAGLTEVRRMLISGS